MRFRGNDGDEYKKKKRWKSFLFLDFLFFTPFVDVQTAESTKQRRDLYVVVLVFVNVSS